MSDITHTTHTPTREDRASGRHTFLMCPPDYYGVEYTINPWMEGNEGRTNSARAARQWNALRAEVAAHAQVEILDPTAGLPDLVFTANAGLVLENAAIAAQFRFVQRRREEPLAQAWFDARGFDVVVPPAGVHFEGAGDALFDRGAGRLWMGYGIRTALGAAEFLGEVTGLEIVPLRLVDQRFYHLDTCFAPLTGGYLIYYPAALDDGAQRTIRDLVPENKRFAVSKRDALRFACNCVDTGTAIIVNACSRELEHQLQRWGFTVVRTPVDEFMMAGGGTKCLCLRLDEPRGISLESAGSQVARRVVTLSGQLLDSGLLTGLLDRVSEGGAEFEMLEFSPGVRHADTSTARLAVTAPSLSGLDRILAQLLAHGAVLADADDRPAQLAPVEQEGVAPRGFYSTTIYPTDVRVGSRWIRVSDQRMDGVIVVDAAPASGPAARVTLLRDLHVGQQAVVGVEGIRIHQAPKARRDSDQFRFMGSDVSSERRVELAVEAIAWRMNRIRDRGGRIVVVPGPVVIHTGGVPHFCELVRMGYVQAVLSGNALAVHDIEHALFGTSLGVDLQRGVVVEGGHRHHVTAINEIRRCGSIAEAVAAGVLTEGLMFELVTHQVPFILAGSIRDDGPLPETEMDLVRAQAEYARLAKGADMILMLASMLHSIGVGNMTPAGVPLVCVDINAAVATKLADRGSAECRPVVTDVGLFLNLLVRKLQEMEAEAGGTG